MKTTTCKSALALALVLVFGCASLMMTAQRADAQALGPGGFGGTSTPNAAFGGDPYAFNPFQMQTVCDLQQQVGLPIFPTICGWPAYTWEDFFDVYPTGPFPPFLVSVPRGSVWPALPLSWPVGN